MAVSACDLYQNRGFDVTYLARELLTSLELDEPIEECRTKNPQETAARLQGKLYILAHKP